MDNTALPVPARLAQVESVLQTITGTLDRFGSVLASLIPATAPVVAGVDAVGHVAEEVLDAFERGATVDAAALAAGSITKSTGNPTLDARLAEIETLLVAAIPVIKYLANEFGLTFDAPTAAPMTVTAIAAPVASLASDA